MGIDWRRRRGASWEGVGKAWKASLPYAPPPPGQQAVIYWNETLYDALGRTVQVKQPNNAGTTTYSYAGPAVTVTDPKGRWKTYENDAQGNLIKVTEPNPAGGTFVSNYTYL